jgi:hypothetical protein
MLYIYIQNKHNIIMNLIKLQTLSNIQYMGPYIFIHINLKQSFLLQGRTISDSTIRGFVLK